jgi:hypothetical protein
MKPFLVGSLLAVACVVLASIEKVHAQARPGRLILTIVDPTNSVVANAKVTVVGLEAATRAVERPPAMTSAKGDLTIEGLAPGRYSVTAEFPGFELGLLKSITVKTGDNKHVVVLPLKGFQDSVTVGVDRQSEAADRRGSAFGSTLTREQVEALSDDPAELAQQLQDMSGGESVIRVDSFEGAQLPPKSQIKAIHITRDSFAAENHSAGAVFVDVITQPGSSQLRGNGNINFSDGSMTGRSPFVPKKGPEQNKTYNVGLSGTLIKNKSSFSINAGQSSYFDTPNLNAALPTGTQSFALNLRRPRSGSNFFGQFDYALTKDQTFRLWYSQSQNVSSNNGIGAYDLAERAYSTESKYRSLRMQEAGPIGRRFFTNTRFDLSWGRSASASVFEAPTIRVTDAFTAGGAQLTGGNRTLDIRLQTDLDYVRGIHSWRTGIDLWGTWFESDNASNYLGTYTFSSLAAYQAGRPTFYTRRIGDPLIEYFEVWTGAYVQDDIRVRKGLTLSPGLRYEVQNHLLDWSSIGPRFGVTWAPFASGKTSIRGSAGIFYDWVSSGILDQTLRVDGYRQREMNIVDPAYPDLEETGVVPPTNRYTLDRDAHMARNKRVSIGVDQTITPRLRGNVSFASTRGTRLLRGVNLNAPIGGVRPDAAFGTVIRATDDARSRLNQLSANLTFNLVSSPAANAPRFNWKRMSFNVFYTLAEAQNDTDGAFSAPASGKIATEWAPSNQDIRHRISAGWTTTMLKNLNVNLNVNTQSGRPYTMATGLDDNGDLMFNDRPAGVDRNTLRFPWTASLSGAFSYAFAFGKRSTPLPGGIGITMTNGVATATTNASITDRYRVTFNVRVSNLTNHTNYVGYSGVMTSPFFMVPTASGEPRRVNFSMNFSF